MKNPTYPFLLIDFFCGAGGVSIGIVESKLAKVVAALNHSPQAIRDHKSNHKNTIHFEDDIRKEGIEADILKIIQENRKEGQLVVFWCSAECTNFSAAKGGASRDRDSRTLVNELFRYITACKPDYVLFENVKEFKGWGPLIPKRKNGEILKDRKGKPLMIPDPAKKGRKFLKWRYKLESMGYNFGDKLMNSADYGAFTSRTRWFAIFAKKGLPIAFPLATHSKKGTNKIDLFGNGLKKWKACKEKLDLEDEGISIFGRKYMKGGRKPLVHNSLRRIAFGIKRHCLKKQFITSHYGTLQTQDLNSPCNTITTKDRHSLIFLKNNRFITQHIHKADNATLIDRPLGAILTKDLKQMITINQFIASQYSGGGQLSEINQPCPAITTRQHHTLVSLSNEPLKNNQFIGYQYTRDNANSTVNAPLNTITTQSRTQLISLNTNQLSPSWLEYMNWEKEGENRVIIYKEAGVFKRIEERKVIQEINAEKRRFIETYFQDSPIVMAFLLSTNFIQDIKMRFLKVQELKEIQGFPANYHLTGSKAAQTKSIGNSVTPIIPKRMMETLHEKLIELDLIQI